MQPDKPDSIGVLGRLRAALASIWYALKHRDPPQSDWPEEK